MFHDSLRLLGLGVLGLLLAIPCRAEIEFNEQIRPILSKHCIACHGPDEEDRQADLRLDTFEGATADLGGYAAIEPGDPESSEIIERIVTEDPDLKMPPPEHAEPLSEEETELLKAWVAQGAEYERHWSFVPPVRPEVPEVATGGADQPVVHNEIDAFIVRSVHEAGLTQSAAAEPRALIRRVSLGLTGLPPIAHEAAIQEKIDRYLAEPDQEGLGRVVDALLQTTAYAEHWAAVWLDIARYADTVGYSGDEKRDIWPWRDWLIRSISAGKSYEQLSIEMLAGDLLPDATDEQRLATAFHRNTLSNNEGGTDDEEFRTIAVKDRLSTTLNGWMGLTVRCAECHSHKYDPISHEEYYQLLDFFNQTADSDRTDERPKLAVRPKPDASVTAKLNAEIDSLEQALAGQPRVWTIRRPSETSSLGGTRFELLDDDSILATGPNPRIEEYHLKFELAAGESIQAIRVEAIPHLEHDNNVGRSNEGAFILSQVRLIHHQQGDDVRMAFADAEADYHQVNRHPRTSIAETVESGAHNGWAVNHPVSGYKDHHEVVFELKEPLVAEEATAFTLVLRHDPPWPNLNMGCVRIATCDVPKAAGKYKERELDPTRRSIRELVAKRDAPVRVPVIEELANNRRRTTHVMLRGNFRSPGEPVNARLPESFVDDGGEAPTDRLGLARWLFSDTNPLTARVAVNRYWSRLMGAGLVETEEDFGTQGLPPSHPELLDYLAVDFREQGWDVRHLLRKIVMSATYQQGSALTAAALDRDPRNRLLSRGPRVRLSAEVVRDQALAVSGLLSGKSYGPPVYPPSPIKRFVNAFTGGMTWQESEGEDRHRRAIYTFLKRSAPHPLFETFDMASRETCSFRRLRTNTPLQSFMTLNDITFIEAARALADKMLAQPKESLGERIRYGLRAALYVDGTEAQADVLSELYQQSYDHYATAPGAAAELVGEAPADQPSTEDKGRLAERAAMAVVANVILNLDGFLNN